MAQKILRPSGLTTNNKLVLHGVYKLCASNGISLVDILHHFNKNNLIVDWEEYIENAFDESNDPYSLLTNIEHAVKDVYGKEYWNDIVEKLRYCFIGEITRRHGIRV